MLFAATNIVESTMIDRNIQHRTIQEFIRFLNVIKKQILAEMTIRVIVDKYAAHEPLTLVTPMTPPTSADGNNNREESRNIFLQQPINSLTIQC